MRRRPRRRIVPALRTAGSRVGIPVVRASRAGSLPPALTELQMLKAREMYDELDDRGKRKYTVAQISQTFGVSRKTIYRHLEHDRYPDGRHQRPGDSTRPSTGS
ncbi:MAG: hypothetical protein ACRDTH_25980 [Pseudonocardiaceae bacterium]